MDSKFVCRNIVKTYSKNFNALDGVNLELEGNKIYGLIGRNGVGKTTLLGILSGQNKPTSGEVTYNGKPVWENQEIMDKICFSREINSSTTFGSDGRKAKHLLKLASIFYKNWDNQFEEKLIKEFEIDVNKRLYKMSKGMLSAVSIIIALASRAEITFLDEPVAGLDVVIRERFYKILLDDFIENPRTYIISTHIIDEASAVFEEIILMEKGKVIIKENTEELLSRFKVVSGRDDVVENACKGLNVIFKQPLGRSLNVCVESNCKGMDQKFDVDIIPLTLQKLFIYLTEHYREEEISELEEKESR